MPPKPKAPAKGAKGGKGSKGKAVKEAVRIDANKHNEALKEIEMRHIEANLEEMDEESEEYLDEEEMGSEEFEVEEEEIDSDVEPSVDVGRIDLSFPETTEKYENSEQCYLPSYYTLSPKERLLLFYAENFRKQYFFNYPNSRPLVLAVPNECEVQKFVSTTIRPTGFVHLPLISSIEGCANFVADYIMYEPLPDVLKIPTRLVSPYTLLRRRRGNCYEMATLLCSMLIGAGYPAVVVSGVARLHTVLNDQSMRPYPYPIPEIEFEEEVVAEEKKGQKYKLRPMPDLESHLQENLNQMYKEKEEQDRLDKAEREREEKEALELKAVDKYHYRRYHAWVAIIDNAPWSIQTRIMTTNENGDEVEAPPSARFIEPSTGFYCDERCQEYIQIHSVWHQYNYYVNKQKYDRVMDIRWDLRNLNDWEHFLPGEPMEMRVHFRGSEENLADKEFSVNEEKHLDTIRTWVNKLHIGEHKFDERFPNRHKQVNYYRTIHARYSPYSQQDGKTMQVTIFEDDQYKIPLTHWEFYENRADFLNVVKYTYANDMREESFLKGRNDSLKYICTYSDVTKTKNLYFYSAQRVDSLKHLAIIPGLLVLHFKPRNDRCFYQQFEYKTSTQNLKKVIEKFSRDPTEAIPANKDIAVRTFLITQKKILLKFHYDRGALTASTREFNKPPKPDYGQEIKFDPTLTKSYKSCAADRDLTSLEQYKLLLQQLECEESAVREFERLMEEITEIMNQRFDETANPVLTFKIFDSLRNGAARAIRMQQYNDKLKEKLEAAQKPADLLLPYLIPFLKEGVTTEQSWKIYHAILNDLKTRAINLLNELQRRYEDLDAEAKSLSRFLSKFQDHFNNVDFEGLQDNAEKIQFTKRMLQHRLAVTREETQKKHDRVKHSLLNDPRLNLYNNVTKPPKEYSFPEI